MKSRSLDEYLKETASQRSANRVTKDSDIAFDISNKIIKLRLRIGITQRELADRMETRQSSISRIESGNYLPNIGFLNKIAHACGTRLEPISFEMLASQESGGSVGNIQFYCRESDLAGKTTIDAVSKSSASNSAITLPKLP